MSVFDAPTTEQEQDDAATANQDDQTTDDWIKRVASEKGDNWNDPQTVAKGYYHAQQRIKELEALVEGNKENDYAKRLLEQLQGKQATETPPAHQEVEQQEQGSSEKQDHTSLSPEDIESLLEKTLSTREKQARVESALKEKFGSEANRVVHDRAKELGLSIDRMKELANESPDAFLRLVGEPEAKQTNSGVRSSVNTASGFNSNGERNMGYYQNLRRTNRKLYNSLHNQMMSDRVRLGDKFYQ